MIFLRLFYTNKNLQQQYTLFGLYANYYISKKQLQIPDLTVKRYLPA